MKFVDRFIGLVIGQSLRNKAYRESPPQEEQPRIQPSPPPLPAPVFRAPTMPFRLSDEARDKIVAAQAKRLRKQQKRASGPIQG